MEIQQMRYFVTSGKTQSFAQAAQEHGVSRQAIALSIRQLENEYGVRLFERNGAKIFLTKEGEAIFERMRLAVEMFETLADGSTLCIDKIGLTVDARLMPRYTSLWGIIQQYQQSPGKCTVDISEEPFDTVLSMGSARKTDICLLHAVQGSLPECKKIVLKTSYLALAVAGSDPLAAKPIINASELENYSYIARNGETARYQETELGKWAAHLNESIVGHLNHVDSLSACLSHYNAVALDSVSCEGTKEYRHGCVYVPITGLPTNRIEDAFFYPPDSKKLKHIEGFLQFCAAFYPQM